MLRILRHAIAGNITSQMDDAAIINEVSGRLFWGLVGGGGGLGGFLKDS